MQLVIDIPEEMMASIKNGSFSAKYNIYDLCGCVMNGAPLPEGHGRLIDADALPLNAIDDANYGSNYIKVAPTVIESDAGAEWIEDVVTKWIDDVVAGMKDKHLMVSSVNLDEYKDYVKEMTDADND